MRIEGAVRVATGEDMDAIEAWLPKDGRDDTLAVNWLTTMEVFEERRGVFVWAHSESDEPLGYCWGTLNSTSSCIEVHPLWRRHGIGRAMLDFMVRRAEADGEPLLKFEAVTHEAVQLCLAMGYQVKQRRGKHIVEHVLPLARALPEGKSRSIKVLFLPERGEFDESALPLAKQEVVGVDVPGTGRITLERCAAHFRPEGPDDLAIELLVDGVRLFRGKAKRSGAAEIGVEECRNGFMVREVVLPD